MPDPAPLQIDPAELARALQILDSGAGHAATTDALRALLTALTTN